VLADLGKRFEEAVQAFWDARDRQQQKQIEAGKIDAGTRGAVTGGTQMGALETLLTDVLLAAGLSGSDIRARTELELPGYYRPEKKWDLLVVADRQLLVAVEFKSQVGPSFGNNFNNRTEESDSGRSSIQGRVLREKVRGHVPAARAADAHARAFVHTRAQLDTGPAAVVAQVRVSRQLPGTVTPSG